MASVAEDRAMLALDKQLKLNEVGKVHISTPSPTWIVLLRLHFKHTKFPLLLPVLYLVTCNSSNNYIQ